jgi:hypothetical protein
MKRFARSLDPTFELVRIYFETSTPTLIPVTPKKAGTRISVSWVPA